MYKGGAIRIGTRGSTMALAQTNDIARRLAALAEPPRVEIVAFTPVGDRDQTSKLDRHGGKGGAFVGEIREAIRTGKLEAAMHSLKDMPGDEEAPGLTIAAMLSRESAGDALVLRPGLSLDDFESRKAEGLKIGTNAVRRAAFLRRRYPQAEVIHYRGAVDTRLRKLDEGALQKLPDGGAVGPADALVVATAGLKRIGAADRIAREFSFIEMPSAVGQGIVAVETARNAFDVRQVFNAIDDPAARAEGEAEREMLWLLDGHCNAPIAGRAMVEGDRLSLYGAVISTDGGALIEARYDGDAARPRELGRKVAMALIDKGARAIIAASDPGHA